MRGLSKIGCGKLYRYRPSLIVRESQTVSAGFLPTAIMVHCIESKARKAKVSLRKNPQRFDSLLLIRTYLAVIMKIGLIDTEH